MARRAGAGRPEPARLPRRERDRHRLTRTHARTPNGKRAPGTAPSGHGKRRTVLGALAREDVAACMSVAAATRTAVLRPSSSSLSAPRSRAPALRDRPDAIVVMDNLAAHKAEPVRKAWDAAGIDYRYLPAYPPDLNPVVPCWAKLKTRLRARAARTLDALEGALGPALATIIARDAQGWFRLCGYSAPNRPRNGSRRGSQRP